MNAPRDPWALIPTPDEAEEQLTADEAAHDDRASTDDYDAERDDQAAADAGLL